MLPFPPIHTPARDRSKRTRSPHSSRDPHHEGASKPPPTTTSSTSPRTARPSLASRTTSAPQVPAVIPSKSLVEDDDFEPYSFRDSVTSIKDDPFFRNYQSPHSVSLARELRSATYLQQNLREDDLPEGSPLRSTRRPSADTANFVNLPPQSRSGMADINIAIIGSAGVGKSTLIQRALGLRSLPTSIASSARMSVDNVVYTVSLIELDLESFDGIPDRKIYWPKHINGHMVPRMDGALLLYDVMNRESIAELPQTLTNPIEPPGTRRRATSSANLEKPPDPSITRPLSQQSKHSRASSEYSLRGVSQPPSISTRGQPALLRANGRTNLHHQISIPDPHEAPPLSSHPAFRHDSFGVSSDPKLVARQKYRTPLPENSFLDMEESDADSSYRYSDDIPILQRNDDSFFDKPAKVAGVTFDELVDRLLGQNMSRADHNFSDIFLCLYRKFAAPGELFAAILNRLERIANDKNTQYLTRTATQLRYVTVVAKWVSAYPGDFASPSTSSKLDEFITSLSADPVFAAAAQDMRMQLRSRVVEDDDTGWARTDADMDNEAGTTFPSAPPSPARQRTLPRDFEEEMNKLTVDEDLGGENMVRKESHADSTLSNTRTESLNDSLSPSFHTVEDYEREAATMIPRANLPLTKFRYHIFMDTSDEDFADEMTRVDWVMFSSIRLRDLVRHVSLSLEQRDKCKSLMNVERMVSHFNHIAKWVANMILMRDKAKHRAQMLEKFMTIALKLRLLNNYNGLAAVLAGINGTAIHRLAQTRALVPPEVQKRFARLVLLMGTQKSHFTYRLAWENSPLPRIPFIPLHRRDLVSAEEGSRTFVGANGERINWKKFEILSEIILPIMKSQVVPYPNLARHEGARELILDCKMPVDDEDIYQRSIAVESSSSSGSVDSGKKKFPWFQKEKS
ncbi:Ras guanine nucleotide exchange factor A [Hyphodiscus hymeniophilus]|uniref:Ras guanine nucleotide exchange factor A n=1 Tax=Hyphodiscus hymeniophilus TaxID=353542 RepID=A0A9P6SNV6_9HELO|nr:Ras guanine nucleotide exchange factor A [Hyphodiscus hymeniophilus]